MRGRLTRILVPAAAVVVTVMLSAAGALATTWSISPAGKFTASLNKGTSVFLRDNKTGIYVRCTVSTAKGDVPKAGHGLSGLGIATLSRTTDGSNGMKCIGSASTFTVVSLNTPWKLNAVSYKADVDKGQTVGTITASGAGIGFKLTGSFFGAPCSMTLGGMKATPAAENVLYDNDPHFLAITGAKNFKILKSNCSSVYGVGDGMTSLTCSSDSNPFRCASKPGSKLTHGYLVSSKIRLTSP